jgi:hypothetical protein
MKSTLFVATLIAAALIGASSIPASAATNNGSFQQSGEGNKALCEGYRNSFLDSVRNAEQTRDESARKAYTNDAIQYWKEAKALGCGWVKTGAQRN